jgi:hypothetical protein
LAAAVVAAESMVQVLLQVMEALAVMESQLLPMLVAMYYFLVAL